MQKRIILAALLSVVVMLVGLGLVSSISVRESIRHSLDQSLELASITANYTDHLLQVNLARLYDVSLSGAVDFEDGDLEPERKALEMAYEYSIFSDAGLFLLDADKRIVLAYPRAQITNRDLVGISDVERAYKEGRPFLTGIHTLADTQRRAIFAFAPLRDKSGETIGVIGGEIDPTNLRLSNAVRSIPARDDMVIELVDPNGFVIASNNPSRVFACSDRSRFLSRLIASKEKAVFECHRCHEENEAPAVSTERTTDMLAFAALEEAPWGVSVREPEGQIFAPSSYLGRRFVLLGLVVVASAFVLAVGLSRSIVNPIQELTQAAKRIAGGKLEEPVRVRSKDEIGVLTESFETMRLKLADSLRDLRRSNQELERRVALRTEQLEQHRERLSSLLYKFMTAQEDERKRIARELHDETLQAAAALGLSLEIASISLQENALRPEELGKLKAALDQLIDGINGLIQDLRPPMLDDLGLESAIRWLMERHLSPKGIQHHLKCSPQFSQALKRLDQYSLPERFELTLFRIVQEAIINIAKHARAENVTVALIAQGDGIQLLVQDDGVGFDVERVFDQSGGDRYRGYGLLGLQERVGLLGGELDMDSAPSEGTTLSVNIPLPGFFTVGRSEERDGSSPAVKPS